MTTYFIQDSTLTALADSTRDITGSTDSLTPSDINQKLEAVLAEIQTQSDLIDQIMAVLESKGAATS